MLDVGHQAWISESQMSNAQSQMPNVREAFFKKSQITISLLQKSVLPLPRFSSNMAL